MNQNEQGVLYPFRLSGSRMRQRAVLLRRQGRPLDALFLLRRAAEQDDTPAAWLALATELRLMGNWEAAAEVLARVLSRDDGEPGAWLEMGRCLEALGHPDAAVDCAYHQLQASPWSPEGDAARAMLAELESTPGDNEPHRTQRLIHRGLTAWQAGDRALGERRLRRAVRMTADQERLLVTAGMMCMMETDLSGAMHYLPPALRLNPDDPRTLTALSTLFAQQGKRRMARAFLQRAGKTAASVLDEDGFLTAAWAQDAWPEMEAYLEERMKQHPHRKALLSAKASMCCERGELPAARELWKEILTIDPEDRYAASMLQASQGAEERLLCMPGLLPASERQRQLAEMKRLAENRSIAEVLTPGSRSRRLLDWLLTGPDSAETRFAMSLLERNPTDEAAITYLKELLCRPFLPSEIRQWALIRLAEAGCRDEMLLVNSGRFSRIACRKVKEGQAVHPWRMFLPVLLESTRQHHQSREIAEFAADIWRKLSHADHMEAAAAHCYAWCKALEVLYLRMTGQEAAAARTMKDAALSARKISRVLRSISRCMQAEPVTE